MPSTIELAPDVYRIPTMGRSAINSFALLEPDGSVTLVDAGLKQAPKRIVAALGELGKQPGDVERIVLTHAHYDHAGGAHRLRERTGAPVSVHHDDAGFARAGEPPPIDRSSIAARVLAFLPGGGWDEIEVDEEIADGQLLDVAGGLRVIHTPGHTPGHVSLLHEPSGTLITGDALFNWRSRLSFSIRFFCTDITLSRETAWRLADVDYETAAFTHGPEMRDRPREQIKDFLVKRLRGQEP